MITQSPELLHALRDNNPENLKSLISDALQTDPTILEQLQALIGPTDSEDVLASRLLSLLTDLASSAVSSVCNDASIQTGQPSDPSGLQ